MHEKKDKHGNSKFNDRVKAELNFYVELYSSNRCQPTLGVINIQQDTKVPCMSADKAREVIKNMACSKAAGEDGIATDSRMAKMLYL